jgi:tetratricopeptide (TPR) repeat protein
LTQLRRLCSWLAVAGLFVACPRTAQSASAQSPPGPDRFQQWLAAIDAHTPGDPGKIAVDVSTWTGEELEDVVSEAKRLARTLAKTDPARANHMLLRGAALHADIGRLIPEDTVRRSPSQQSAYVVSDGRWTGMRYISIHWQLGRSLLDSVVPSPAGDPDVLAWYLDTSADLRRMRESAAASVHYERARQLFPSDPQILFGSGLLHESFASANLQAAADSVSESNRSAAVSSMRSELVKAERFFRDVLAIGPAHLEARVRYGRVLDNLGRHAQAAEQLRRAIAEGAADELLYLAQLFLGRAEEAAGHPDAAQSAFERASELYPNAQSPRLALSQLARRAGNRPAAQRELQALAALPGDERRREDPWWFYFNAR